jgi:hypothetical protein
MCGTHSQTGREWKRRGPTFHSIESFQKLRGERDVQENGGREVSLGSGEECGVHTLRDVSGGEGSRRRKGPRLQLNASF